MSKQDNFIVNCYGVTVCVQVLILFVGSLFIKLGDPTMDQIMWRSVYDCICIMTISGLVTYWAYEWWGKYLEDEDRES